MSSVSTVVILEVGAEGGSVTVVGQPGVDSSNEYSVRLRDQSLTLLLGDEKDGLISCDMKWTRNWAQVITTLDRWPWPMLFPLHVDPAHAERVILAVTSYRDHGGQAVSGRGLTRWSDVCRRGLVRLL
jgi:hypothetical protein